MSNRVYNYIKVYGKDENLKKFKEDVALNDEVVFSFNKFIVKPEDTTDWAEDGTPGWYMWGIANWSTKCDCWDAQLSEEKDHLVYEFTTASDIPDLIYENMVRKYKKLDFKIDAWDSVRLWKFEAFASGGEFTKFNFKSSFIANALFAKSVK